jgi:hypothetical protein
VFRLYAARGTQDMERNAGMNTATETELQEREIMGLEMVFGGLRDGLAVMPPECASAKSLGPLAEDLLKRIAVLRSPARPPRRTSRRTRR